jgi:hypothetical protein
MIFLRCRRCGSRTAGWKLNAAADETVLNASPIRSTAASTFESAVTFRMTY